jgi:hypothetical protein
VVCSFTVEAYLSGAWVNLTADVAQAEGLHIRYGIDANGPLDCVADPGECSFALVNEAKPSTGRLQGWYSPGHANVRAGWTWGVPIRVTFTDPADASTHIKHRGKAYVIDPAAGKKLERLVRVVSYDGFYDLDQTDARSLSIAVNYTESQLISAVLDALPIDSQPVARAIDTGLDTYPYAFYDLGDGIQATTLINDIAVDAYALVTIRGDGTFVVTNRNNRVTGASALTLTDATMREFVAPSLLSQALNLVRVTIHPPTLDDTATTVLYADPAVRSIAAGHTDEFWVAYSDPTATARTLIGGLDVVNPLVAGTDYLGNSQADGLGSNMTSSLSVNLSDFGSTAKLSITNTHGSSTIYLVDALGAPFLQIRGKGVYDLGPQTYQSPSVDPANPRTLSVDLRYQDDPGLAQSYADFLVAQRSSLANQPQSVGFSATTTATLMTQALAREPGDKITVTETMTGFSAVAAVIQSVELQVMEGSILSCRWGLAPGPPFQVWSLGTAGLGELGQTTVLGF